MQFNPQQRFDLYVANLDDEINEQLLYNYFSQFGYILSIKIMRHILTKKSRGFGFVTFKSRHSADKALRAMNGKVIFKNPLQVYSKEKYKSIDKNANVYFSKLPKQLTEQEFTEMVNEIGSTFSIKFNDQENEEFNNAYVQYETLTQAKNAIGILDGKEIHGQQIQVGTTSKKNIVFIRGRDSSTILNELKEVLEIYGEVILSEKTLSQNNEYIISIRFSSEEKAHSFLIDFQNNSGKYDMIKTAVSYDNKKEIYNKFKKSQGVLYYKISPIKEEVSKEQILERVKTVYKEQMNVKECVLDQEEGELTFSIVFGDSNSLITLIKAQDDNPNFLREFVTRDEPNIRYPSYLIKIMKKQKMNMISNMMNPMFNQNTQFPGMQQPMGMMPAQNIGAPMGMGPQQSRSFQGKPVSFFGSVEIVEDNKKDFEQLSEQDKKRVMKNLIKNKIISNKLIDQNDSRSINNVLNMLVGEDLLDNEEIIENLKNDKSFADLVDEALQTAEENS